MGSPGTINAKESANSEKDNTQMLKHVHIGVFFDGTNNNMVQQVMYNGKFNISLFGLGKKNLAAVYEEKLDILQKRRDSISRGDGNDNEYMQSIEQIDDEINSLKNKIAEAKDNALRVEESKQKIYKGQDELRKKIAAYNIKKISNKFNSSSAEGDELERMEKEIADIEAELQRNSAWLEITEKDMMDYSVDKGFSNIAVLYSLFDLNALEFMEETPAKAIKFYIEGSGATDMSCYTNSNVNGLGFGLGNTGVTALVSKGVRFVTDYVNSLSGSCDENTKVHLYVFGFSRGATCARLFTHIATRPRDVSEILHVREKEFQEFIPNLIEKGSGRVKFLEDNKLNWKNITVEILGIYDPVASIGFLRQKDGWYDPLRGPYSDIPDYVENWHYKNVTQYGLYLNPDRKKLRYAVHIGALDEFRENFAFTNLGGKIADNAIEILIPGCHSDVGGGYMDGVEQEISLSFNAEKAQKIVRTMVALHDYHLKPNSSHIVSYGTKPELSQYDRASICAESLRYLGWISDWDSEKNKSKDMRTTVSMVEHKSKTIYFRRRVKRGWSDVSLKMLISIVNKLLKEKALSNDLFQLPQVYDYSATINDAKVRKIADVMVANCVNFSLGSRYLLIPGGKISSETYRYIRLYYIHFTSTSSLGHAINPLRNKEWNAPLEFKGANFGNKPNFDNEGNLCRIMYNGDKVSSLSGNNCDNSHAQHVHYMYDMKYDKILNINA